MIVVPGGGHRELVFDAEGRDAAEFLNELGVAAFVLKYRLAREKDSPYKIETHVRARCLPRDAARCAAAPTSGTSIPNRIGILGFSAGGEVVAHGGVRTGRRRPERRRPHRPPERPARISRSSSTPARSAFPKKQCPPTRRRCSLICANDDRGHIEPTIDLLTKYRAAGAPVEAHIYSHGGHAFNMGHRSELATLKGWPQRMADWLADNGWLDPQHRPTQ